MASKRRNMSCQNKKHDTIIALNFGVLLQPGHWRSYTPVEYAPLKLRKPRFYCSFTSSSSEKRFHPIFISVWCKGDVAQQSRVAEASCPHPANKYPAKSSSFTARPMQRILNTFRSALPCPKGSAGSCLEAREAHEDDRVNRRGYMRNVAGDADRRVSEGLSDREWCVGSSRLAMGLATVGCLLLAVTLTMGCLLVAHKNGSSSAPILDLASSCCCGPPLCPDHSHQDTRFLVMRPHSPISLWIFDGKCCTIRMGKAYESTQSASGLIGWEHVAAEEETNTRILFESVSRGR
ncbi:hypothetical protein AAG570_010032 [Ranatra chinensis]|uniref:Uncharacterized protein n=1 Tax=Ranatra chinensis TaxID=642074 RepID=A0ABD0Z9Q8_9HEMI